MLESEGYFNPQEVARQLDEADLDNWLVAYEDMWKLIKEGHSQSDVINHLVNQWDDGEVGRFLQWVRFYESEDDKKYAIDMQSSFIKVAVSVPGISMRNVSLQEMITSYKKRMFSRLKALRSLVEEAVFKLPDDLVMDHVQAQKATHLISQLSEVLRNLKIDRSSTPSEVIASVKNIEDLMCKIGVVMANKTSPLVKMAGSTDKQEILQLLQSAHKSFVEKPSVRELALAFAKDALGQFPDIGQALAKMIEAHNYVTPRIEEIMSNISVQLGTEIKETPQKTEEVVQEVTQEREAPQEPRDIEVKMPTDMPRVVNR